jgi:hypothetical protein
MIAGFNIHIEVHVASHQCTSLDGERNQDATSILYRVCLLETVPCLANDFEQTKVAILDIH